MQLFEMFDPPVLGLSNPDADNSKPRWKTSRKTKLTLSQIRKLRRMLDVRAYERKQYLHQVRDQYGSKPDDQQPPMM